MATQRTFSQIVQSMMERLRLTQPNLDTKEGAVARDLFIDIQADELDRSYRGLKIVSDKQSPEKAIGKDLDRWARNFGILRKSGTRANGICVYTINDLNSDIPIPSKTLNTARNGFQFKTIGNFVMSVAEKNKYAATANRLRTSLNLAGITDSFAIEVPVAATRIGTSGNIAPLQIINSNLADGLKVTNLSSFSGGTSTESDSSFRARIFAVFSGANTGTESGYRNAALSIQGVLDSLIVKPGNTLMLRDGTETIEINNGSFRILNSGTGGKVDVYILGKKLEEVVESFIYSDLSGAADPTDERNDIIPGLQGIDKTLTSEERRVSAFETGNIPLQPIDSIVSIVGSSSGILLEESTDAFGNTIGNYRLEKDNGVEVGGTPFGFDKIHFISSTKTVDGESITKKGLNSIDVLRFSDVQDIEKVYQDVQINNENSLRSPIDRNVILLNHYPTVTVSRVLNFTTGELYVIENQNIDSDTGLNLTGEISISGKTLPSSADILSVDYIWRNLFDKYIDFNGTDAIGLFSNSNVSDAITWEPGNGIFQEEEIISQTDDGFEYTVQTKYNVSNILSVFLAENITENVSTVIDANAISLKGIEISSGNPEISTVISVKNTDGVELYHTIIGDGTFSGRTLFFPSDTSAEIGDVVNIFYNKIEVFDIESGNGTFSDNIITLPSEDILNGAEVLDDVDEAYLLETPVYIKYIAAIENIIPSVSLSALPINGNDNSNELLNADLTSLTGSNQPIFFNSNDNSIERFGPCRLGIEVFGTLKPGRVKIFGTTLTRAELVVTAGLSIEGLTFNLESEIKDLYGLSSLPSTLFVARVDKVSGIDSEAVYDVVGQELLNSSYAFGTANVNIGLKNYEFTLPSTANNSEISFTSGEEVFVSLLIGNSNDSEVLYFPFDSKAITHKVFGRINNISAASGFRNSSGNLIGTLIITPENQPENGLIYNAVYNFIAPKEGERLTVRYNSNKLIRTVTAGVENVRPITADVLVKESQEIPVDINGEIVVADSVKAGSGTVLENTINAVVNLLNTSSLGGKKDYSDIITTAASVTGVESVNISLFNESGKQGRKSAISALDNQSITAGNISFEVKERKDFRIT